jgi:long-chain acyl-CoA synthetase
MQGYWKAPEETARALRAGWLHTGDIASKDAQGYVRIVDRKKEMIKYKGFGIAPAELEALLHEHPGIADCAVVPKPDPEAGEIPRAFVVLHPGAAVAADELIHFVAGRVAGYKQIRAVVFVDEIPKNPSGKILRRVLRERP